MNNNKFRKMDDTRRAAFKALEDFKTQEALRREDLETLKAEKRKKKKIWFICQWIVFITCIAVIIFQLPKLVSALKKINKPIRQGTYDTDGRTDQCIRNLWELAGFLQRKKSLPDDILDPASNKPYEVTQTKDETIVRSPSPELYGFKEIRASKKNPVPELIK
ncbi:MAG: hypothetical protein ABII68_02375 [Pseudomonadota bacterium]